MNESKGFYVLVQHATVVPGTGVKPFTADIGISGNRRVRTVAGQRQIFMQTSIGDLGDLRTYGGLRTIDATGLVRRRSGAPICAKTRRSICRTGPVRARRAVIAPGQPAEVVLLRPLNDPSRPASRYVVTPFSGFPHKERRGRCGRSRLEADHRRLTPPAVVTRRASPRGPSPSRPIGAIAMAQGIGGGDRVVMRDLHDPSAVGNISPR